MVDAINVPTPAELADYFPVVPQSGTITLEGRDARLLVASGHTVYVFEQSVPLEVGKAVEAVALPLLGSVTGYEPALHVFAMAIGS